MPLTLQRTSRKNEKLMDEMTKILMEGRREGTRRLFIAGDLNSELGLRCTDEDGDVRITVAEKKSDSAQQRTSQCRSVLLFCQEQRRSCPGDVFDARSCCPEPLDPQ